MSRVSLLHNPRCSKSRQAKALLEERLPPEQLSVLEYLKDPLTEAELRALSAKLGLRPAEFIRKKEAAFAEAGLATQLDNDDALFAAIAETPKLMERPIAVADGRAIVGRPPERVLSLLGAE